MVKLSSKKLAMLRKVLVNFSAGYFETFAPTAKLPSIRIIFALGTPVRCEVFQFDVSLASLNADLEEYVYVQHPPGFKIPGKG